MSNRFEGQVAIVTGSALGIGKAAAVRLASEGASVGLFDLPSMQDENRKVATEIDTAGGSALAVAIDVSRWADWDAGTTAVLERFGRLDVLINNAGISGPQMMVDEYDEEEWDRVVAVDLKGVWLGIRAAFPHMRATGGGAIINVGSTAAFVGYPKLSAYTASKHGVIGLTKSAAVDGARDNIRVNCVCPSGVETPMLARSWAPFPPDEQERQREALLANKLIRRFAGAEEIASLCVYLASAEASFATGAPYLMDGGQVARS